ncbi:MAG: ABC transporter permease subunit [Firmicutes bacterium]|nr:ABC transporter permease subunit [Bacillota bacterium]
MMDNFPTVETSIERDTTSIASEHRTRLFRNQLPAISHALGLLLAFFLLLPILGILSASSPENLWAALHTQTVLEALLLSVKTSVLAMIGVILFGTPLAHLLARRTFPGKFAVELMIQLPWVTPPAVAGLGLLLALGAQGLIGRWLTLFGINLAFSTAAVVLVQIFEATGFYVQVARQSFAAIAPEIHQAAALDGASALQKARFIELPLTATGLIRGLSIGWARALGEFGATMLFAGNLPGITQTMPLAIYTSMQSNMDAALALSILLLLLGAAVLAVLVLLGRMAHVEHDS